MNTKLNKVRTEYSKFSKNQVLTEKQLNQFLDYFDDQDHLSRVALSGVGIVCGFEITLQEDNSLIIKQGNGVTTDGDFIYLRRPSSEDLHGLKDINFDSLQFTHYRLYENKDVPYAPFTSEERTVNTWELSTSINDKAAGANFASLSEFESKEEIAIQNMVVLLYLEYYSQEGDLCSALTCDNQGIEQIHELKVLLVTEDDAEFILRNDTIYNKHHFEQKIIDLPKVKIKRVLANANNTKNLKNLKNSYYEEIVRTSTLEKLGDGLDTILTILHKDKIKDKVINQFKIDKNAIPWDFQYKYDRLKDLISTYNELRCLLLELDIECLPNLLSFPKHLMLGKPVDTNRVIKYRHKFYKSPTHKHNNSLEKISILLDRVDSILTKYQVKNDHKNLDITPSNQGKKLGEKAIPFYYDVDEEMVKSWDSGKTGCYKEGENLSFHKGSLLEEDFILNPLNYSIDDNNFLRIEGHQGMMYREAFEQITKLKEDHGLPFDLKMLSLEHSDSDINLDDYACEFEDLKILVDAWTSEQDCVLKSVSSFFSSFSIEEPGENVKEVEYTQTTPSKTPEKSPATKESLPAMEIIGTMKEDTNEYNIKKNYADLLSKQSINVEKSEKILEKINQEEETIGKSFLEIVAENPADSKEKVSEKIKRNLSSKMDTKLWEEEPVMKDFVLNSSVDLLLNAYDVTKNTPLDIKGINKDQIIKYETSIEDVCNQVKKLKTEYQKVELKESIKEIVGLLIIQLSTICCAGEKLNLLLREIEKRKEEIILQTQLSKFAAKHPGLEHHAGVPIGGTFVLAYLAENAVDQITYDSSKITATFTSQPQTSYKTLSEKNKLTERDNESIKTLDWYKESSINSHGKIVLINERASRDIIFVKKQDIKYGQFKYSVVIGESIAETVSNLADFLNSFWEASGVSKQARATAKKESLIIELIDIPVNKNEYFLQFMDPKIINTSEPLYFPPTKVIEENKTIQNTVIADFALPYMCCSDCKPINYVLPKTAYFLGLPTESLCIDEETERLPFTVRPADGVVRDAISQGFDSAIVEEDGMYFFDPSLLDESYYGTPLKFTVNDEPTSCKITIYKKLTNSISTSVAYNRDKSQATVTFTVLGDSIPNYASFLWEFGDGTSSSEKPSINYTLTKTYSLPVNIKNVVSPKVTIHNGNCEETIDIKEITFDDPIQEPKLDEKCIEANKKTLEKTYNDLNIKIDIDSKIQKGVISPMMTYYKNVIDNSEKYLGGAKNSDLMEEFKPLFNNLFQAIITFRKDQKALAILSLYLRELIKLFYAILHCQSKEVLEKDAKIIQGFQNMIASALETLLKNKILIDQKKELSTYLTNYLKNFNKADYISNFIQKTLIGLLSK